MPIANFKNILHFCLTKNKLRKKKQDKLKK